MPRPVHRTDMAHWRQREAYNPVSSQVMTAARWKRRSSTAEVIVLSVWTALKMLHSPTHKWAWRLLTRTI
jgi:hypothetical protein